ncbi:sialate O-acetylesterase [Thiofilum flexile]|uniref:sialate O-acetylesterase n=1 Tax=Thiofilum flexile TaxID=125627 RepID=UPI00037D68A1|nr:sialate O-acetylesterase [Thiofilum flexile]
MSMTLTDYLSRKNSRIPDGNEYRYTTLRQGLRYVWVLAFFGVGHVSAAIQLPALISDHMVLQQHTQGHLWGRATPNEQVSAHLAGRSATTIADTNGQWSLYLPQIPTGTYELQIQGKTPAGILSSHTIRDVAIGAVWLAAGQSNMEWPLSQSANAEQTIARANHPSIRVFRVPQQTALTPQTEVSGYWEVLTPQTAGNMSGVAYHFAHQLQEKLQRPIGIIQASWGSTQVAAWTGMDALQHSPELQPLLEDTRQQLNLSAAEQQQRSAPLRQWEANNYLPDPGDEGLALGFARADFDTASWQNVTLPQTFSQMGFKGDGAVWFRREVILPESWQGQEATLMLGMVDDFDVAYVNGVQVGTTTAKQPHHWLQERRYTIPAGQLRAGSNTLAVRVFDQYGDGGFTSRAQAIVLQQGQQRISLAGDWKYHITYQADAVKADFASQPTPLYGLGNRNTPAVLYNAMIAPLTPYPIQGVIWYQGEADTPDAARFKVIFPLMIQQWRMAWQQTFPFFLVQLANFGSVSAEATRQKWAEIRAVQTGVKTTVANTGMVSAIDVGEADNIHPKDKRTVGTRLANLALSQVYGESVAYLEPVYTTFEAEPTEKGQRIRLHFEYAAGLYAKGAITAFELAGADGQFFVASAVIEGNTIVLQTDKVPNPQQVRYAWRDNPLANIYNKDALPLLPFMANLVKPATTE